MNRFIAFLIAAVALAGCKDFTEPAQVDTGDGPASLFADPTVVATIYTGGNPIFAALYSPMDRLFVTAAPNALRFTVINTLTNTKIRDLPQYGNGGRLAVNPVTHRVYSPLTSSYYVRVFDARTYSFIRWISTYPERPTGAAVNPSTNKIYVGGSLGTLFVIDGSTNTIIRSLPVGGYPGAVGVNPTTNRIYVANATADQVIVINGATDAVAATIPLPTPSQPRDLAVNPTTNRVYVPKRLGDEVFVIDGATNSLSTAVTVPSGQPQAVGVNSLTNRVYATAINPPSFHIINGATNAVCHTVDLGPTPRIMTDMEVDPATNRIYVPDSNGTPTGRVVIVLEDLGADTDGDGIEDDIDDGTAPPSSDRFSDVGLGGSTWGAVTTQGDQRYCITDVAGAGIRVRTDPGGIPKPIVIEMCSFGLRGRTVWVMGGGANEVLGSCSSSSTTEVVEGSVDVTFVGNDGREATATLLEGNSVTFDEEAFTFTAGSGNTETIVVVVDGVEYHVAPGETLAIVWLDIKPGGDPNCINKDSRGHTAVAVLATDGFDPADIDVSTAQLDGVDWVRYSLNKDVSGDEVNDLVFHFRTQDLNDAGLLTEGNRLTLSGSLLDEASFEGSDVIYLAGGPNCRD